MSTEHTFDEEYVERRLKQIHGEIDSLNAFVDDIERHAADPDSPLTGEFTSEGARIVKAIRQLDALRHQSRRRDDGGDT